MATPLCVQRQHIAFRGSFSSTSKLILDEATSSLDSHSEKYVQRMVEILREQKKTVLIIAYRLITVFHEDAIVVLENGKVVEQGQHDQLLQLKGTYYGLWKQQFLVISDSVKV